MKQIAILIFCFALANCAKVETAPTDTNQNAPNKIVQVSPTIEKEVLLKPITPNVKFNGEQQKNLNESLPKKVREILEKAEKFEILAEVDNKPDGLNFDPNRIAVVSDENDKKEILEALYFDASDGDYPSACYIPHHAIRATFEGKTVEVEICYECHLFTVKSPFGNFDGGIKRENQKSEKFLNKIIETKSVELKK